MSPRQSKSSRMVVPVRLAMPIFPYRGPVSRCARSAGPADCAGTPRPRDTDRARNATADPPCSHRPAAGQRRALISQLDPHRRRRIPRRSIPLSANVIPSGAQIGWAPGQSPAGTRIRRFRREVDALDDHPGAQQGPRPPGPAHDIGAQWDAVAAIGVESRPGGPVITRLRTLGPR